MLTLWHSPSPLTVGEIAKILADTHVQTARHFHQAITEALEALAPLPVQWLPEYTKVFLHSSFY